MSNATLNVYTQPAEEEIAALILESDGRWQYDDNNRTDLPTTTTTVTSGQKDYGLAVSHLKIERVELQDSNSQWTTLEPYDKEDDYFAVSQLEGDSGVPTRYRVIGNSIVLDPIPNYTQSASLKIFFQRGPLTYDYSANSNAGQFTDGTGSGATADVPGFASLFHDLIAYKGAHSFAVAQTLNNANTILTEVLRKEKNLKDFYGKRNKDDRPKMTLKKTLYI